MHAEISWVVNFHLQKSLFKFEDKIIKIDHSETSQDCTVTGVCKAKVSLLVKKEHSGFHRASVLGN